MTLTSKNQIYNMPGHIIAMNGDIVAVSMTVIPTNCYEPCNVTVMVTWQNVSNRSVDFWPTIVVNKKTRIELDRTTLPENESTIQTFNITDLVEGTYTICPHPR